MKHLYGSLRGCAKEKKEDFKAEFCKFFKLKNCSRGFLGSEMEYFS